MLDLLKNCYREIGIKGVVGITLKKRENVIKKIREEELLSEAEYEALVNWLINNETEAQEEALESIENLFREEDTEYTNEDEKELHILVNLLLYFYCLDQGDCKYALVVMCAGMKEGVVRSKLLYHKFSEFLENQRLETRHVNSIAKSPTISEIKRLNKSIKDARKEIQDEESFEYTQEYFDALVRIALTQEQNLFVLDSRCKELQEEIDIKSEEIDILWWMNSEWSEVYQKFFSECSIFELSVGIPYELNNNSSYSVFPFSGKNIIKKIIARYGKDLSKKYSLSDYVCSLTDDMVEDICRRKYICQIQPFFLAANSMVVCGKDEEDWKGMFKKSYGKYPGELIYTPFDFAWEVQMELELSNYLGFNE